MYSIFRMVSTQQVFAKSISKGEASRFHGNLMGLMKIYYTEI